MINKKFKLKIKKRTLLIVDWANVYGWRKSLGWEVCPRKLYHYFDRPKVIEKILYHGTDVGQKKSEDFKIEMEKLGFNVVSKEVKWPPVILNQQTHFKETVKDLFNVLDNVKSTNSNIATKLYELKEKIENRLNDEEPDFDTADDGQPYIVGTYPSYDKKDGMIYNEAYDLIDNLDKELKNLNSNIGELQQRLLEPVKRRKCDFDVEITRDALNKIDDYDTLLLFSGDGDYFALTEDLIKKGKKVILVFAEGHKGKEYNSIRSSLFYACSVDNIENFIKK